MVEYTNEIGLLIALTLLVAIVEVIKHYNNKNNNNKG